jgi:PAS domain S-box-containing protein
MTMHMHAEQSRASAILTAVGFAAKRFVAADDWAVVVPEVLAALGIATQVSRVYLYENSNTDGRIVTSKRGEWTAPGFVNLLHKPEFQHFDLVAHGFERWIEQLGQGNILHGLVESYPPGERALLRQYGVRSQVVVAIMVFNRWWGFIGFDDCVGARNWSTAEQDALLAAASIIGATIQREQTTTALRKSEGHFQALLDALPIAIWAKDMQGRYQLWSGLSPVVFRREAPEALGKTDAELFDAERANLHVQSDKQALSSEQPVIFEGSWVVNNIEQIYELTKFALRDGRNEPYAVYGLASDITQRKRAERNLRLLADTSTLLNSSLDYGATLQSVAQLAVKGFADWCTVIVISTAHNAFQSAMACANPKDQDLLEQLAPFTRTPTDQSLAANVFRTGNSLLVPELDDTLIKRFSISDGHFAALKAIDPRSLITVPLSARGQPLGAMTFTLTRGARRYTVDDLALAEELARRAALAVDNAWLYQATQRRLAEMATIQEVARTINSTIQLDAVFRTVVDQISRAFGYEQVSIYLRQEDVLRLQAYVGYDEVLETIQVNEGVSGRVCRTGEVAFVHSAVDDPDFIIVRPTTTQLIVVPIRNPDNSVQGTVLVESDGVPALTKDDVTILTLLADQISVAVTNARLYQEAQQALRDRDQSMEERLVLERKLLETQKLESLGMMAGGIAHDFNNLLMTIIGNTNLALLDLPPEHPGHHRILQIETATKRAADLTAQMLAYAGKGHFIIEPIDLNLLVREMATLLEVSLPKSVTLRYNLASNALPIIVDATQIRQVVINLISNAAEASNEKGGTITLTTTDCMLEEAEIAHYQYLANRQTNHYVALKVQDYGSGMDSATQARIFDPFFTTKFAGRGLGLAAVLGIVRSHQGAIKVESVIDEGTTITILLPYNASSLPTPTVLAAQPVHQESEQTVLVVDDEESVRAVTSRLLERLGYQVQEAANGEEALHLFNQPEHGIGCVLLDLTMPGMNGEELLRHLRQLNSDITVIVMSGYSEDELNQRLAGLKPNGVLHKPFTLDKLRTMVRQAFEAVPHPQFQ